MQICNLKYTEILMEKGCVKMQLDVQDRLKRECRGQKRKIVMRAETKCHINVDVADQDLQGEKGHFRKGKKVRFVLKLQTETQGGQIWRQPGLVSGAWRRRMEQRFISSVFPRQVVIHLKSIGHYLTTILTLCCQ